MAIANVQIVNYTAIGAFAVSSTGSGHLLVLLFTVNNPFTVTSISDNASGGSNTYVEVPNTQIASGTTGDTRQIWYCANSKAGATSITPAYSGGGGPLIIFSEFSGTRLASSVVDGQIASGSGTNKKAPTLTTVVGDELLVAGVSCSVANPSGINSPWIAFSSFPFRGAYAINPGTPGPYAPQWTPDQTDFFIADGAVFAAAGDPLKTSGPQTGMFMSEV